MSCQGLSYRGVDIHTDNIHLDIHEGFAEPPTVRGEDVIISGQSYRTWMPKVADRRIIELRGIVRGTGTTLEDRQQSWRDATDDLMALLDRTDTPGTLLTVPPYLGLTQSYSVDAVCINVMPGPVMASMTAQTWSIQLEAYADWAAESS
jgi:hypothetical protein